MLLLMNKTSLFASSASHLVALSSFSSLVNSTIVTRDRVVAATSHHQAMGREMAVCQAMGREMAVCQAKGRGPCHFGQVLKNLAGVELGQSGMGRGHRIRFSNKVSAGTGTCID